MKRETTQRLMAHAQKHYAGRYVKLDLRFRGAFCYIDAETEPAKKGHEALPMHLCRLRYCGHSQWSVAFFAYSSEKYEPCALISGSFFGTPEEGFDVGAVYLQSRASGTSTSAICMNPVPRSNDAWLTEIAAAYMDAREAVPYGPLAGTEVRESDLFHLAPSVCLKFRRIHGSKAVLKKATDAALISYVATGAQEPEVFAKPHLAFAFCYLAAHFGLDILSKQGVAAVMDFVVDHEKQLVRLLRT